MPAKPVARPTNLISRNALASGFVESLETRSYQKSLNRTPDRQAWIEKGDISRLFGTTFALTQFNLR